MHRNIAATLADWLMTCDNNIATVLNRKTPSVTLVVGRSRNGDAASGWHDDVSHHPVTTDIGASGFQTTDVRTNCAIDINGRQTPCERVRNSTDRIASNYYIHTSHDTPAKH